MTRWLALAGALLWTATATASTPTSVLVHTLRADATEAALAARLTEDIVVALSTDPSLRVLTDAELEVMVGHTAERDALRCETDDECLARLAERAAAGRLLTGRLGRLGKQRVVTLKLTDTRHNRVLAAESITLHTEAETTALQRAARRLFGADTLASAEAPANAPIDTTSRVAVFGLRGYDVRPDLPESLAELLSVELRRAGLQHVVSRRDVADMVGHEVQRHLLACDDDTECLIEIAGNLDVDALVSGSIGRLGEAWFVQLTLMDMRRTRVLTRVSESYRGPESTLPFALRAAARALLGRGAKASGGLELRLTVDEGRLRVGEAEVTIDGNAPHTVDGLEPGRLGVSLSSPGFAPLFEEVYVESDRRNTFVLDPEPLPEPWYAKWWVWTAAGVAITGAVITGIALADNGPETGTVIVRSAP